LNSIEISQKTQFWCKKSKLHSIPTYDRNAQLLWFSHCNCSWNLLAICLCIGNYLNLLPTPFGSAFHPLPPLIAGQLPLDLAQCWFTLVQFSLYSLAWVWFWFASVCFACASPLPLPSTNKPPHEILPQFSHNSTGGEVEKGEGGQFSRWFLLRFFTLRIRIVWSGPSETHDHVGLTHHLMGSWRVNLQQRLVDGRAKFQVPSSEREGFGLWKMRTRTRAPAPTNWAYNFITCPQNIFNWFH